MDSVELIVGVLGIGGTLAGLAAVVWGLLLVVLRPDGKSRGDATISIGGGAVAVAAGLGALSWAAM